MKNIQRLLNSWIQEEILLNELDLNKAGEIAAYFLKEPECKLIFPSFELLSEKEIIEREKLLNDPYEKVKRSVLTKFYLYQDMLDLINCMNATI